MPQAETTKAVRAGQVISSALMNEILERLQKIEDGGSTGEPTSIEPRVQALETWQKSVDPQISEIKNLEGRISVVEAKLMSIQSTSQAEGKVRISGFDPPTGTNIGTVMTILGDNFASNPIENVVLVGNVPVNDFRPDSTLNRLKFIVPPGRNLSPGNVSVYVSNCNGKAQANYTLYSPLGGNPPEITDVYPRGERSRLVLYIDEVFNVDGSNLALGTRIFTVMTEFGPVSYIAQGNQVPNIREINEVSTDPSKAIPVILEVDNKNPPSAMVRVQVLRTK